MDYDTTDRRNLASLLSEMKDGVSDFLRTRLSMMSTELREKSKNLKTAALLAVGGLLLLSTAYVLITLALVGLVVAAFPANPYRWFFAFLAVGLFWTISGGIAAYFAKRELEIRGLLPQRTIAVLKGDKVWVEAEMKKQI